MRKLSIITLFFSLISFSAWTQVPQCGETNFRIWLQSEDGSWSPLQRIINVSFKGPQKIAIASLASLDENFYLQLKVQKHQQVHLDKKIELYLPTKKPAQFNSSFIKSSLSYSDLLAQLPAELQSFKVHFTLKQAGESKCQFTQEVLTVSEETQ